MFGKYFAADARGGAGGGVLALPSFAVEHTETLYARAKGRPLGYLFDVAQAFVYQVCIVFDIRRGTVGGGEGGRVILLAYAITMSAPPTIPCGTAAIAKAKYQPIVNGVYKPQCDFGGYLSAYPRPTGLY